MTVYYIRIINMSPNLHLAYRSYYSDEMYSRAIKRLVNGKWLHSFNCSVVVF
jgi:hypothetical protein